ncbi:phosphoglycolate phosphatase [Gammaproteobacteria bacterium]
MSYRLIIFDWDGTLIDSEVHIVSCFQKAALDLELAPLSRATVRNIIGLGLMESSVVLFPDSDNATRQAVIERYRYHYFLGSEPAPSSLFPGVEETLRHFHDSGYLLAVATGKSRRGLDRALRETNLGRFFHITRCADETKSKPDPLMLQEILEELDTASEYAVMVGDTEYDMEMAHNVAMPRIAMTYGVHEVERLRRWGPLACLDDFPGLRAWFDGPVHGAKSNLQPQRSG